MARLMMIISKWYYENLRLAKMYISIVYDLLMNSHGHLSYYLSYTQSYDMLKYCRTKSVFYTGSHAVSQKPIKRDYAFCKYFDVGL